MEGNQMKMREALEKIYTCVDDCDNYDPESKLDEVIGIADAALSAPARQCDVGSAEEQAERFVKHCQSFLNRDGIKACVGCPCCGVVMYGKCELAWAQMPYEAEKGGEE